ncbi:hypothetical protein B0H65DRAFT_553279 [Neurospora tetraspora]|uniref:Uncharacterized protein n=1 Tax=Neurospora tetraspora TaxID=94610 RepID=A0AAE0MJK4_9PEZI|nr:hypothetical protein B0H65DRAFT_553279 [Neurospora tetraspora]
MANVLRQPMSGRSGGGWKNARRNGRGASFGSGGGRFPGRGLMRMFIGILILMRQFGHTYDPNRPSHSRLSETVSDPIDGDGVGNEGPYRYPTLRTRARRSATVPTEGTSSSSYIRRPHPREGLGVVAEDFPWEPPFKWGKNNSYFSDDDDDDNHTYDSSSSSSSTACSQSPTDSILKSSDDEGAGCLKPPTETTTTTGPQQRPILLAPVNAGPEETFPNTPPEDVLPEREPEWDGMARSEPPFQPMFMGKHFDPRDPYRYGRGPPGRGGRR